MATLSSVFTDIANAIRAKGGITGKLSPANMANAIRNIAVAKLQQKSSTINFSIINYNADETQATDVLPDSGYDGMSKATLKAPLVRDYTITDVHDVTIPSTVYNGTTPISNSSRYLIVKPTKVGWVNTNSYLAVPYDNHLGTAEMADVGYDRSFSSSKGFNITGSSRTVRSAYKQSYGLDTTSVTKIYFDFTPYAVMALVYYKGSEYYPGQNTTKGKPDSISIWSKDISSAFSFYSLYDTTSSSQLIGWKALDGSNLPQGGIITYINGKEVWLSAARSNYYTKVYVYAVGY